MDEGEVLFQRIPQPGSIHVKSTTKSQIEINSTGTIKKVFDIPEGTRVNEFK